MSHSLSDILLVTDFDGTLLQEDKSISPEDMAAIGAFRAAGGQFTIATGRSVDTGEQPLRVLDLDLPCVLYNGSMLYDFAKKEVLWMADIPLETQFLVGEVISRFGEAIGAEVLTPGRRNVVALNDMVRQHLYQRANSSYRTAALEEIMGQPWLKVVFVTSEEQLPALADFLMGFSVKGVRFVRSERYLYEILPAEANKGSALERLCRLKGFSLSRTVAVGDCDNDLEMIQTARVGVAVGNAFPSLKAAADMTTVSNGGHAVATVIRELMADPETFLNKGKDGNNG